MEEMSEVLEQQSAAEEAAAAEAEEASAGTEENEQQDAEEQAEMSRRERAGQAEGRRIREREARAYQAGRSEASAIIKRIGIKNPETGKPIASLEELEAYDRALSEQRFAEGTPTAEDIARIVDDRLRAAGKQAREQASPDRQLIEQQMARIRAMDPAMKDLGTILRSEAGEKFQEYVRKGLDFVDAYTLAARDRLAGIAAARSDARSGGKEHLTASGQRGSGMPDVPKDVMSKFHELNPRATDEEIRKYYAADLKRMGKKTP